MDCWYLGDCSQEYTARFSYSFTFSVICLLYLFIEMHVLHTYSCFITSCHLFPLKLQRVAFILSFYICSFLFNFYCILFCIFLSWHEHLPEKIFQVKKTTSKFCPFILSSGGCKPSPFTLKGNPSASRESTSSEKLIMSGLVGTASTVGYEFGELLMRLDDESA